MEVKVTQADREAAENLQAENEIIFYDFSALLSASEAFARHRIYSQAELIEALEEMLIEFDVPSYSHRDEIEVCAKARAVIAKAKGDA